MNATRLDNRKEVFKEKVTEKKFLNIMILLAELANEITSPKDDCLSERHENILEEYMEGIQFILLLGDEYGYENDWLEDYAHHKESGELSTQFMQVLEAVVLFRVKKSAVMYKALLYQYLQLGKLLGLTVEEIEHSIVQKRVADH